VQAYGGSLSNCCVGARRQDGGHDLPRRNGCVSDKVLAHRQVAAKLFHERDEPVHGTVDILGDGYRQETGVEHRDAGRHHLGLPAKSSSNRYLVSKAHEMVNEEHLQSISAPSRSHSPTKNAMFFPIWTGSIP
jgi:hypothetical protein